ncbi:leucine rich repeat (LRR) protein [Metamycoplasma subdolum]|uniref:Leucine rich repeat (LRR) protein n=2 Tax=Metamycoplasma subdolum TaxID=92407 RepID=A0A3M0AE30_9BACT|nr:leucine-rich repeat protein [Metamycoplasma subdolum]RMA77412.1 leucine rich repeat (LRR) protein [Metamycoplasma subdolum]WPB50493.1 leucine-rich repeat protein [Metamycoplasma subdolum]
MLKKPFKIALIALGVAAGVATVATIAVVAKQKKDLRNYRAYIESVSSVDKLLPTDVEQFDGDIKPNDLPKDKKGISKIKIKDYEEALNKAKKVTRSKDINAAKKELEKAVEILKNSVVIGTSTAELAKLKYYIAQVEIEKLLKDVEQSNVKPLPENTPKGKKVIWKDKVLEYQKALDVAKAVTEETKAAQAKKDLEKAVENLISEIVTGTSEKNLDALKFVINQIENDIITLLSDVQIIDGTPKAEDIAQGTKAIAKSEKEAMENAIKTAKEVTDETKAEQAKKDLEAAFDKFKNSIVVGISTAELQLLQALISQVKTENILKDVLRVDGEIKPDEISEDLKAISKQTAEALEQALADAEKVTVETEAEAARTKLQNAFDKAKGEIVQGKSTKNIDELKAFLETFKPEQIKKDLNLLIIDKDPLLAKDIPQGRKGISKKYWDKFVAAWNKASEVTKDSLAKAAKDEFSPVVAETHSHVLTGTYAPNVDKLKGELIKYSPDKILKGVTEMVHSTHEPMEILEGKKEILQAHADEYRAEWQRLMKIDLESEAIQGLKDLNKAKLLVHSRIVHGKASAKYLEIKKLLMDNTTDKIKASYSNLEIYLTNNIDAGEVAPGTHGVTQRWIDFYTHKWNQFFNQLKTNEDATDKLKNEIQHQINEFKTRIVKGTGTTLQPSLNILQQYTEVKSDGTLQMKDTSQMLSQILNGSPRMDTFVVPKKLNGITIKKIGGKLFSDTDFIRRVKILAEITDVEYEAFVGHTKAPEKAIKYVDFPNCNITFDNRVFADARLENIILPNFAVLSSAMFYGATIERDLVLPDLYLKTIPTYCFQNILVKGDIIFPNNLDIVLEADSFLDATVNGSVFLPDNSVYTNNKAEFDKASTQLDFQPKQM